MIESTVIPFDATERKDRRAHETAERAYTAADREAARLADALGVSAEDIQSDGAWLLYHGQHLLHLEAAYRESESAGRAALRELLTDYHRLGYESGLLDRHAA